MKEKEIMKKLKESAKLYKENLQNKNLLIMYEKDNKIEYIEILFLTRNFMHLTGVRSTEIKKANQFYQACLTNKLNIKTLKMKEDGTTQLKMDIISNMIKMEEPWKIIGVYNGAKEKLKTDILLGKGDICLGVIKEVSNYYIPNTLLKEDIRKITKENNVIVGIFKKEKQEEIYQKVTNINKNIEIERIRKNEKLASKLKIEIINDKKNSQTKK